jgi:histone chaperone ASF1
MSLVNVINIIPKNAIDKFQNQFRFEIVFECLAELKSDIEWKLIYIGKADDTSFDQELDSVLIGPLQVGQMKFDFEADAPDWKKIPKEDLIGVTAIILTCSYTNQEFFRVGYYINNVYGDDILALDNEEIDIEKVNRYILHDKPRITKFNINWDSNVDNIPTYSNFGMFDSGKEITELKNEFEQMQKKN